MGAVLGVISVSVSEQSGIVFVEAMATTLNGSERIERNVRRVIEGACMQCDVIAGACMRRVVVECAIMHGDLIEGGCMHCDVIEDF